MSGYYWMTRDRQVVACDDLMEWSLRFGQASNQVARSVLEKTVISTVFLGLDHNFGSGPPVLFETMIFDRGRVKVQPRDYMERYCTIEQALAGHARAVYHVGQLLRKGTVSSTSRNAREGRFLVRQARAKVLA